MFEMKLSQKFIFSCSLFYVTVAGFEHRTLDVWVSLATVVPSKEKKALTVAHVEGQVTTAIK